MLPYDHNYNCPIFNLNIYTKKGRCAWQRPYNTALCLYLSLLNRIVDMHYINSCAINTTKDPGTFLH